MKTLKLKLYSHKRNRYLKQTINAAGKIYNHCIALHRRYYRMWGKHLNCCKLQKHIAKLRKRNPFWQLVGSQAVPLNIKRVGSSTLGVGDVRQSGGGASPAPLRLQSL